jgi:5-oxoprolinase (ATP-hydrolysing)
MNVFQCNFEDMAYGETICGGAGAGKSWVGQSGVHIHMVNLFSIRVKIQEQYRLL